MPGRRDRRGEAPLDQPRLNRRRAAAGSPRPVSGEPDGPLFTRLASGDQTAFDELYRRYGRAVYALVARMLSDHGLREEAVQDTFVSVWRSAARYDPRQDSARGWILAIARNRVTDTLRRGRPDPYPDVDERGDPQANIEAEVVAASAAFHLHAAVAMLPPAEAEVIELAYWLEFSQTEIAAHLGIPLGTIKSRTSHALTNLARILDQEEWS